MCGAIWSTARSKTRHRRTEELVNWRANHEDDDSARSIMAASVVSSRRPLVEQEAQQLVGAGLEERHLAAADALDRLLVGVVDANAQARVGEGQRQRQADVAAAAQYHDVERVEA